MNWQFRELKWRLIPGSLIALIITFIFYQGSFQPLEQVAYNKLFQLRGAQAWDERVVAIKIDDNSLKQIGRFPWNRQQYVNLLDVLSEDEGSVVAFDMLWSEPSPDDTKLAEAIAHHGQVILAQAWDSIGLPILPLPEFQNTAIASGHIFKREDADGIVRETDAQIQGIPAFAIATAQVYGLVSSPVHLPNPDTQLRVNWVGTEKQIPTYSFVDVVQKKIPPGTFRNKIVLVGVTATGFDALSTPFDRNPPTSGVYLQATIINNLLKQNLLKVVPKHWLWLFFLVSGSSLSLALSYGQIRTQLLLGLGLSALWGVFCFLLFRFNYWIPVATPIFLFTSTLGTVILCERLRMNLLLQQQVQMLWQAHHQDLVVHKVDGVKPVGESFFQQPSSIQHVAQLAALAEQFGRSQSAQAAIARSLSVGLLAADLNGLIWFCNPVAVNWLHTKIGDNLQPKLVPAWLSEQQWSIALSTIQRSSQTVVQEISWSDRWFELKLEPLFYQQSQVHNAANKTLDGLLLVLEEITERKRAAIAQEQLNQQLTERSAQLELVNQELETFSYAVSHDLRAPLRRINGFSHMLLESSADQLDEFGKSYLNRIQASVLRMGELIEDLLNLSRITRTEMHRTCVDLSAMVTAIAYDLQQTQPERDHKFVIEPNLTVNADERLIKTAIENLLGNAWKYTNKRSHTQIEFGVISVSALSNHPLLPNIPDSKPIYFIRDNGAGFEMAHVDKLFGAFQRLHTEDEFPGTGVGLMTTKRIIHRHNGRIWGEAKVDQGATFYFTL